MVIALASAVAFANPSSGRLRPPACRREILFMALRAKLGKHATFLFNIHRLC